MIMDINFGNESNVDYIRFFDDFFFLKISSQKHLFLGIKPQNFIEFCGFNYALRVSKIFLPWNGNFN